MMRYFEPYKDNMDAELGENDRAKIIYEITQDLLQGLYDSIREYNYPLTASHFNKALLSFVERYYLKVKGSQHALD